MGTVLFAWELGGGLGHVGPMRVLAERLVQLGHQPVFAVREVATARSCLGHLGPILQAPFTRTPSMQGQAFGAGNLADILALRGFADPVELRAMVHSWADVFQVLRPGLLVADFSPTALVAAHGALPIVIVGYGFHVPPTHLQTFPSFRDDVPPVVGEQAILANVRHVLTQRKQTPLKSLPSLFRAHYTHCYSLPWLDPYSHYRRGSALGPIEPMPEWSNTPEKPSVFAYLPAEHPSIQNAVISLAEIGVKVEIYIRGKNKTLTEFARRRGLRVLLDMPSLVEIVPKASAVVSHGGSGIAHAALLAGRAQLLLPVNAEQQVTATMLQRLGVAVTLPSNVPAATLTQSLRKGLTQGRLWTAAKRIAAQVRQLYQPEAHLEALVEACNGHLIYSDERQSPKP
jgi:UDP:flavonoid glycosyltransferase YjiC (YdhE family)